MLNRIESLSKSKEIPMTYIARAAHLQIQELHKIAKNKIEPNLEQAILISKALNARVETVFIVSTTGAFWLKTYYRVHAKTYLWERWNGSVWVKN